MLPYWLCNCGIRNKESREFPIVGRIVQFSICSLTSAIKRDVSLQPDVMDRQWRMLMRDKKRERQNAKDHQQFYSSSRGEGNMSGKRQPNDDFFEYLIDSDSFKAKSSAISDSAALLSLQLDSPSIEISRKKCVNNWTQSHRRAHWPCSDRLKMSLIHFSASRQRLWWGGESKANVYGICFRHNEWEQCRHT